MKSVIEVNLFNVLRVVQIEHLRRIIKEGKTLCFSKNGLARSRVGNKNSSMFVCYAAR